MRFLFLLPVFLTKILFAQQTNPSTMQQEAEHYGQYTYTNELSWDSLRIAEGQAEVSDPLVFDSRGSCTLNKRVFGWHPYWNGSEYLNYQWNLLSDFCYFDYRVSPNTGNNLNASFQWTTSAAVTAAINNNVDVHICASLFSNHATFLASTTAQQTFINNIISLLQARGGKGVNIDFEGMASTDRNAFTAFMQTLSTQVHTAIPGSEISLALYAVDWGYVFDIPALNASVDLFVIMGYDYYWTNSSSAGPTDPLYSFETTYNYSISRSVTYYLKEGAPTNKLLLGLPYYGREWSVVSNTVPAATTGSYSGSVTYTTARNNVNGYFTNANAEYNGLSNYYPYTVSNTWRQCFINNAYTLGKRFDFVNQRNLGGIGIWALGYDDGYADYWNAIRDHFSDCAVVPCSDTLWDMGGAGRNYYSNENYTTTIAPANAASVSLSFLTFNTQSNVDSLWLYDGSNTSAPLIGVYSGSNSPGTVNSTGPTLSLRFKSDASTTSSGWVAVWSCVMDAVAPTTTVTAPSGWQTTNFNATFTDADNVGGTGIEKSFYQVTDFNATEWRSNNTRGFFNDDFDQNVIHPDWTSQVGIWSVNASGKLEQSDETQGNTNIYAPLTQNLSNRYLYHWQGKITGTGNNRRAGFHFFCDNPILTNRGNSYFVWFRLDQATIEIYKVVNDVFTLQSSSPYTFVNNQWYDFKVSYDRISGRIEVYVNDAFSASWIDAQPYANGSHISFRNGNSNWQVDNFRVYRSRFSNAQTQVTVGNCGACDVRYENPNPITPSAQIRSLTKDNAHLLSQIATATANIDWTAPTPVMVLDGPSADIDTTYNNLVMEANWTNAFDPNSGLANYEYALGSTPGDSDVVAWTSQATTQVYELGAYAPQWYYFSVRSYNNAGLRSTTSISDGQELVFFLNAPDAEGISSVTVFPNPFAQTLQVTTTVPATMKLYDIHGKIVASETFAATNATWFLGQIPAGIYLLEIQTENGIEHRRLIHR